MLYSRQYSSDLCEFFSDRRLMDYPFSVRKSANLHIQDGRHWLIVIFKIDVNMVNALQSPTFIRSYRSFF